MKSRKLSPFIPPPPPEPPTCMCCHAFAPAVMVPQGDGAVPMCWICAHHVVDHGISIFRACTAECECLPEAIYPESFIARRKGA